MRTLAELRPTTNVWLAQLYTTPPYTFHWVPRGRYDVWLERDGHEGAVVAWAFAECGALRYHLQWSGDGVAPVLKPHQDRWWLAGAKGATLPLRLLHPATVLPCRRCFAGVEEWRGV